MNENVIGKEVVDAAVKVHRELGPGLLEAVYEVVLTKELQARGLRLGFVLNFGSNLMKDEIERVANGLPEENLGGFAALRDTQIKTEPDRAPNAAPPHR